MTPRSVVRACRARKNVDSQDQEVSNAPKVLPPPEVSPIPFSKLQLRC